MHSLSEAPKDDALIRESGYEMYDLVPSVKLGPIGRINVTLEHSILQNNFGGVRALYRYHEYSNALWHFEIRNNKFISNTQSVIRMLLPRIYRFSVKHNWQNSSHSLNIRNNEFQSNKLFEINIAGYYAQINITKNLFSDNKARHGLIEMSGTEKTYFVYKNLIQQNEARFIVDLEASSHADNDLAYKSLFADNVIELNRVGVPSRVNQVQNLPSAYTVAIRGIQNCSFSQNLFDNPEFDFEFVGGMSTSSLNSTIDALSNWWGSSTPDIVQTRIFDMHEWNNHALVNFVPFCTNRQCDSVSRARPGMSGLRTNLSDQFVIGGLIEKNMLLKKSPIPYQVRSDLTIMPGVTLLVDPGVEIEFYPNVGMLVLGDLKASGTAGNIIQMRPVKKTANRVGFYSDSRHADSAARSNQAGPQLRLLDGLGANEGFLQVYNDTLREWTLVCDHQFTLTAGSIACKQLGKEHRNVLVKSLFYYVDPYVKQPIWNQTFICHREDESLADCDTFANYNIEGCRDRGEYMYLSCGDYELDRVGNYEGAWGGVRFAKPYFEWRPMQEIGLPPSPIFLKPDLQQEEQQDSSFMNYVHVVGAGRLHGMPNPAVQLVYRTPFINNCNLTLSAYHGLEFIQPKATSTFNSLRIAGSLGYAVNSLILNIQTTDQKSSYKILNENTLSMNGNVFSLVDVCDPHKYYELDQRVLVFYKYTDEARDCVKIFRTRLSTSNLGVTGQIGIRFLQLMLANNTVSLNF